MGNCCYRCFGRLDPKRKYLRTRYNVERDFSIEFENLMDNEMQQDELPNNRSVVVKPHEKSLLLNKDFGKIVAEQRKLDKIIDQKLVRQEEELRMEEEAYYEAKREAARVAKMQKQKQAAVKSNALVVHGDKNAWLGDENEWELAGGEDDFEMFLESVKARSLAARTRALASQVPGVDEQSESSVAARSDRSHTEDASSLDLEWEHEAGMQPGAKEASILDENLTELGVKPMMLNSSSRLETRDLEDWDHDFCSNPDKMEKRKLLGSATDDEADR